MDEISFTPRELDVMSILWRSGSGTVSEVREELGEDLAYTSVLSALQTLEEKRFVRHEAEGRAYRYFPTVAPENAGRSVMARIRDAVFQGSAERTLAARQPAARPRRQPRTAARIPSSPGRRTCCRTRRAGRTR